MELALEVVDLRKRFKTFTLDGVSLGIPRGYILGLIGPNGSGKTTTIRIMMNMLRADAGRVGILGLTYDRDEKEIKNRVGYVPETPTFYENKKVSWTGRFAGRYFRAWDAGHFARLLDEFGIDPGMRVGKLSKGSRVKLALSIALSHDPELLILDEPTAGLDPVVRRDVLEKLAAFCRDERRSVFISSHITDDIMRIADYVAFIVDGRIVINREKDEILANWKRIHFRKGALPAGAERSITNVSDHLFGSSAITGEYQRISEMLDPGIAAGDIKVENVSLDDVLIAFVRGR